MTLKEFIKKLGIALQDEDAAKTLESFGITTEQIEDFKDLDIPTTLDEALEVKDIKTEYSRRLNKAADTRESKLKLKYGFGEEKEEKEEDKTEIDTDNPAMKVLLGKFDEMRNEIKTLKQEREQETLSQKRERAITALTSKGIPEVYVHEFDLEKDVEEQLETISKKFEDQFGSIKTEQKSTSRMPFPKKPEAKNEPSKEEVEAFKLKI